MWHPTGILMTCYDKWTEVKISLLVKWDKDSLPFCGHEWRTFQLQYTHCKCQPLQYRVHARVLEVRAANCNKVLMVGVYTWCMYQSSLNAKLQLLPVKQADSWHQMGPDGNSQSTFETSQNKLFFSIPHPVPKAHLRCCASQWIIIHSSYRYGLVYSPSGLTKHLH